jgi:transcriptional regulator with XRE-family HTH domain
LTPLAKYLDEHGLRARGRQKFQNGRVAALRALNKVTQHQLAAAIGASPAQISQIENGMNFAIHRLLCICDFFEVSPSSFIENSAAR